MEKLRIKDKYYRWIVIGVCFLMVFVGLGFCSGTKSLYLVAITDATGIKRSVFSIADSCRFITTSIANLFFGSLLFKYGAKKMIGVGFLSLLLFALIYANATQSWMFAIGGCFLGFGLCWTGTAMVGHVVNAWCEEHRGTIMGFVLAANGIGSALATQIISPIINREGDAFGYRSAYLLTAIVLLVCALIIVIFFREYPEGYDPTHHIHHHKKHKHDHTWGGIPVKEALRMPYFYIGAIGVFLTGMTLQGANGVAVAHMKDVGIDAAYAATVVSIYSIGLSAAKMLVGILYDKTGLRKTMTICNVSAVLALILLVSVTPTPTGKILALVYALLAALAMPLETIILPLLAADLFGEHSFEKLLGFYLSISTAGYAVGLPLTNLCYDLLGTYIPALAALACVMVVVAIMTQFVLTAADRKRIKVEAESEGE